MKLFKVGEHILGRFEIVDKLGEGAFSVVFKAKDLQSGAEVALKQGKPGAVVDLEDEFQKHQKLAPFEFSPTVYECTESPTHGAFLVMSVEGLSMSQRYKTHGKDFTDSTIMLILWHTLNAINKLHTIGFCHFDLNLGNLAEAKTNDKTRILLLDFECAMKFTPDRAQNDIEQILTRLQMLALSPMRLDNIYQTWVIKKDTDIKALMALVEDIDGFDKDGLFDWEGGDEE